MSSPLEPISSGNPGAIRGDLDLAKSVRDELNEALPAPPRTVTLPAVEPGKMLDVSIRMTSTDTYGMLVDPLLPPKPSAGEALWSWAKGSIVAGVGVALGTLVVVYDPAWLGVYGPAIGGIIAAAYNAYRLWALSNGYNLPGTLDKARR